MTTSTTYDAIIVGARPAGAACAIALAKRGRRVLVVDKATFPSDTMSTLFLQPAAMSRLRTWGLLDRIVASGAPPIRSLTVTFNTVALRGTAHSDYDGDDGVNYSPRRTVLDMILVDAAREAGAEVREGFGFLDVVRDGDRDGRVVGIKGRNADGDDVEERASIVVGADGMRSTVAKAVGAEMLLELPPLACWYYAFYSGVPVDGGEMFFVDDHSASLWPTNNGVICVVGWPIAKFADVKRDVEAAFLASLECVPSIAKRVKAGKREERFVGTGDHPSFVRQSYGPGWALVGDAAFCKDPCTAQGIADALVYGERLGIDIAAHAGDAAALDDATKVLHEARAEEKREIFEYTYKLSSLKPPSQKTLELMAAVARNPTSTAQLLGVLAGTVPASTFFDKANIARMLAS